MQGLKITIKPEYKEVVAGAGIPVDVILTNDSTEAVDIPALEETSPFEYVLEPVAPGHPPYVLSATAVLYARSPDDFRPMPFGGHLSLNPGSHQKYTEDLANYVVQPLKPGRYTLKATYNTPGGAIESPAVPLALEVPNVKAEAIVAGPTEGRFGKVIAHEQSSGGIVLLQGESREYAPADGVLFPRVQVASKADLGGVATAIELAPNNSIRWMAWLQEQKLGALVAGQPVYARIEPQKLPLNSARLHSVGWQFSGESAVFLVLGSDPQGRVALTAVTFEAAGTAAVSTVALAAAKPPTRWAARLAGMDPDPVFDVVWAESGPGRTWLFKQTVTPKTGQAGAVQALCEHSENLAAISLYPLKNSAPDVVDLIYGPSKENTPFNFLRLPLTGGKPVLDIDIPLPQKEPAVLPQAWALAAKPLANPAALALLGDQLMLLRMAPRPQWQVLSKETHQAGHLHLEVVGEDILWAIWADAQSGMNYLHIP